MRVTKPIKLSLLHRTYQYRGENHFAASVFTMFSLSEPERVFPENELWQILAGVLGRDGMLDAAMPKARAEYVVMGNFHAPGGKKVPAGEVSVRIGGLRKGLNIYGDRYWKKLAGVGLGITDPEPISQLPLTFANAFGGADYRENPLGKGASPVETPDGMRQPLPNIELPERLIGSPDDKPPPASFGMLDLTWPQRFKKVGTYDQKWQRERAPGLADDIDWTHFNTTDSDQWLEGFFTGTEEFALTNMHPEKPLIEGRLPGLISRVFIVQKLPDGSEQFRELETKLDTVYFFPEFNVGLTIWRGDALIGTDDAMDVEQIMLAYERLRDPRRSLEHYQAALSKRLDHNTRSRYLLNEADLIPDGDRSGLLEIIERGEQDTGRQGILVKNFRARAEKEREQVRDKLVEMGVNPEELPVASESDQDFNLNLENLDIDATVSQARARAEQMRTDAMEKLRVMCKDLGQDFDQLMQKAGNQAVLPRFSGRAQLDGLRKLADQFPAVAARLDAAIAESGNNLEAKLQQAENAFRSGYARAAHSMISVLPAERAAGLSALRTEVLARIQSGGSLGNQDLAGIDLSNANLRGADFSNAYLEFANFSGADLSEANFSGAILAKANFTDAVLDGADFSGASLGKAILRNAHGSQVKLDAAVLSEAILTGAHFEQTTFTEAQVLDTDFSASSFRNSRLENVIFHGCNFIGTDFEGTEFLKGLFVEGDASRIRFSRARGNGVLFVNMQLEGADFSDAELPNLRIVGHISLQGARFMRAKLSGSNLRGLNLKEANFSGASLDGCEMSDSDLRQANLSNVSATHALFMRSNLEAADLSGINCFEAMLNKARLVNTNLERSNFYGAEFIGVTVGDTRFDGANLKLTKFKDWRP